MKIIKMLTIFLSKKFKPGLGCTCSTSSSDRGWNKDPPASLDASHESENNCLWVSKFPPRKIGKNKKKQTNKWSPGQRACYEPPAHPQTWPRSSPRDQKRGAARMLINIKSSCVTDCHCLSQIVTACKGLSEVVTNCHRLSELSQVVTNFHSLQCVTWKGRA